MRLSGDHFIPLKQSGVVSLMSVKETFSNHARLVARRAMYCSGEGLLK